MWSLLAARGLALEEEGGVMCLDGSWKSEGPTVGSGEFELHSKWLEADTRAHSDLALNFGGVESPTILEQWICSVLSH